MNALLVFVAFAVGLPQQFMAGQEIPEPFASMPGWRQWVFVPMAIGAVLGVVLIVGDALFARASEDWAGFPHPEFPLSILASATAGIGEEILFRLFAMGLWAFLLNLALRKWNAIRPQSGYSVARWGGNVIASLAFGAAHLPATMVVLGVETPADLPSIVIAEVIVLSAIVGIVSGQRYMKEGLIAAVGVHFWTDVVWHILWPAIHGG